MRRAVLTAFKKLHRTQQYVFEGDTRAITACREQINEHFQKNRNETSEEKIKELLVLAEDVAHELLTNVIQAKKTAPDVYELRIRPETTRLDNVPFNPDADIQPPRKRRGTQNTEGCCGGAAMAALETEIENRKK